MDPIIPETLLKILTKEFVEKVQVANSENMGIYQTLKLLADAADIKELAIFLCISENSPVKIETIVDLLENKVSKSTIYRKCSEYQNKGLLVKTETGYLELGDSLKTLKILSDLNKKLK
jgi:hypothetical protein